MDYCDSRRNRTNEAAFSYSPVWCERGLNESSVNRGEFAFIS